MNELFPSKSLWYRRLKRITSSGNYLPEIDGLRFIAIGSVITFHIWHAATQAFASYDALAASQNWLLHVRHGDRGVQLFFAISGFILGLPFANQYLGKGKTVQMSRYFYRRLTRLEPPYLVALVGFYLLAYVLRMPDTLDAGFVSSFWLRVIYAYGLVKNHFHSLNGVTWSLEVEVQFYLLAPFIARVFLLGPVLRRTFLLLLIGGLQIVPMVSSHSGITILEFAQYFLVGFFIADLQVTCPVESNQTWLPRWADMVGLLGLLGLAIIPQNSVMMWLLPWAILLLICGALRGQLLRKFLSIPILTIIGGMCYSIYLIHYPLMSFLAGKLALNDLGQWRASLTLAAITLPILSVASILFYLLIERPCMNPAWPSLLSNAIRGRFSKNERHHS